MTWTERYLFAALRSIPDRKRDDVERELRSSIEDGIEGRLAGGDDRATAERAVLEGLGDPAKLAASYTGRPSFLIGPELYPLWRSTVLRVAGLSVPFAVLILSTFALMDGGNYADVIVAACSAAISVPIQILFWGTVAFAIIERADPADPVRVSVLSRAGTWRLEDLPEPTSNRVTASEAAGGIVSVLIAAGALILLGTIGVEGSNGRIGILHGDFSGFVHPVVMAALFALGGLQVFAVVVGRWSTYMATINALLLLAVAGPIVWLALTSKFFDPYFATAIGWPGLAEAGGWPTLTVAVVTAIATVREIGRGFARARTFGNVGSVLRSSRRSA